MNELFSLAGKVAFVTGAARGLGAAMAEGLAAAGASVVLNDIDAQALETTCVSLRAKGLAVSGKAFDITNTEAATLAIRDCAAEHGRLDILVNNAGILVRKRLENHEIEDWNRVISTNLTALYVTAREAAKHMAAGRYGRIINVSSIMGISSRPGVVSYVAAKHGVIGLTRALAGELGPRGITCNAIAPGYILTAINNAIVGDKSFHDTVVKRTPLARWGEPSELAGPVVFLASEASSFITGHTLVFDGGMTATVFLPETLI